MAAQQFTTDRSNAPAGSQLGPRILETLLATETRGRPPRGLALVHGRYEPGAPSSFTLRTDEGKRMVHVVESHSVLGLANAWDRHREEHPDSGNDLLVLVTEVADTALGWDLLGHAVRSRVLSADRAEIVRLRFGASSLDPRIPAEPWLLAALIDAEPRNVGWPRVGGLLTRDTALRALVTARLGLHDPDDGSAAQAAPTLDADAMLTWSHTPVGPARYAALPADERQHISTWLTQVAGPAAGLVLALAADGRGQEAMPLGIVASVFGGGSGQPVPAETGLALGSLFGVVRPRPDDLRAFTAAVEGTITRWIDEATQAHRQQRYELRERALRVLARADELASGAGLSHALAGNSYLPSGFEARLATLADTLSRPPQCTEAALDELRQHHLAGLFGSRVRTAQAAVRLKRWLAQDVAGPASVADGVIGHLADWGWVDAALTVLVAGDPDAERRIGAAYHSVCEAVRERRARLDGAFADRLAAWARGASSLASGGCLLVEEVLAKIVAPLHTKGLPAPLVLVLDGMSSAVAVGLGAELAQRGWLEASPSEGVRAAAVAAMPSLTRVSRASLLTGRLTTGGQAMEREGFAAFWGARRSPGALLFHKAAIGGVTGERLSSELQDALSGESIVGVVLNTIDESLDHAAQGDRTRWRLADITYLEELLRAARSYGRPVVLVSDHGHVLDRRSGTEAPTPVADGHEGAARWRTGTAGEAEVLLSGPRVLEGGGTIVAPWREDIRYTPRKAGYHGGASLAEMTVPVLALLPSTERMPADWSLLGPEAVTPTWWEAQRDDLPTVRPEADPAPVQVPRVPEHVAGDESPLESQAVARGRSKALADTARDEAPSSLGQRITSSPVYAAQKEYVRRAPTASIVAAVINALAAADGTLSLAATAKAAGTRPERVLGLVAMLLRLLNVEGYPVLESIDGDTRLRLNRELARQQFHLDVR